MKKRLLSVFLSFCMMLTMVPAAFAADLPEAETPITQSEEQSQEQPQEIPPADDQDVQEEESAREEEPAEEPESTVPAGTQDDPFTTVAQYNAAVADSGKNGEAIYLTVENQQFTAATNTFALTNVQSRANPPKLHLTIKGCTFTGNTANDNTNSSFMYLSNCQSLVLENCTFDSGDSALKYGINWNLCGITDSTVEIRGCTFSGTYDKNALKLNQRNGSDDKATDVKPTDGDNNVTPATIQSVVIEDCTFDSGAKVQLGSQGKGEGGAAAASTGAFPVTIQNCNSDIVVELAYKAASSETIETVTLAADKTLTKEADADPVVAEPVAKIGEVEYTTLQAAVDAAQESNDTVTLLKDVELSATQEITGTLTIDLNGHKISNGSIANDGYMLKINHGAKLNLIGDVANSAIADNRNNTTGTITAICVLGELHVKGDNLTISRSNGIAIKVDESGADKQGKLTVESGTISSADQAVQNWGVSAISGGTFNGDVNSAAYSEIGGQLTITGGTFSDDVYTWQMKYPNVWPEAAAKINISGGIFNGKIAELYGDATTSLQPVTNVDFPEDGSCPEGIVSITGGTFSTDVKDYCAPAYSCNQKEEGKYVVEQATGLSTEVTTNDDGVSVTINGAVPTTPQEDVSDDEGLGASTPTSATIKATTEGGTDSPKDATIIIPASTAATMTSSTGYELTVEADAATVTLNKDAMEAIQSAAEEDGAADITVEIKKPAMEGESNPENMDAIYSVTVKAGDEEILSEGEAPANTAVTITVPAPQNAQTVYVWLMTQNEGAWKRVSEVKGAKLSGNEVIFTTSHLSDYAVFTSAQESDYAASYTGGDGKIVYAEDLNSALTNVQAGGTITLLKDVTLTDPTITLSKAVTIRNAAGENHKIDVSMNVGNGNSIKTAFTLTSGGKLTLDGVTMNVKTADDIETSNTARNAAFSLTNGTELNMTNGAQVNLDKLQTGMYMPGSAPVDAKVILSGAGTKLTAKDINGNFSNGGQFEVKNGAELSINGCGSHGLSANKITVEDAKIAVENTKLCGIITVDTGAEIKLEKGAEVIVKDCATGEDASNRAAVELSKSGTDDGQTKAKLTMDKGSSLSVSGTGDCGSKIALAAESGSSLAGNIAGSVQEGDKEAVTYYQIAFNVTPSTATVVVKDASGTVQNNVNNAYALKAGNYTYEVSADGYYTKNGSFTVSGANEITVALSKRDSGGGSSGGGGSSSSSSSISVSSASNGSVSVSPRNAAKGDTVTITVKPDAGYELDTLTVTDKSGDEISVTSEGNNKYTFTMPSGKVTVKAVFAKVSEQPQPDMTFNDVSTSAYYYDAVKWAVEKGITSGTSATTFSPDASCTRAEMVTFLWRANGSPRAAGANPFTDVQAGSYYYDAVLWAVEEGITSGTSATTFAPNATVTRGQTVTFLHRANGSPAASGSSPFTDVASGAYYTAAVQWAVAEGVTSGTSATTFAPDAPCTRAQIVTFLYRDMA